MQRNARPQIRKLLQQLFVAQELKNEDEARSAGVLQNALTMLILLESLAFFILPISDTPLLTTIILSALILASLAGQYVLRQGNIRRAAALFCAILWIITTIISLISGGVTSPLAFAYIGVITIAGLVFSRRTTIVATAFCVATSCILAIVSFMGMLPPMLITVDWLTALIVQLLLFIWLAYLLFMSKSSAEHALTQVRSLNGKLQQEIHERQKALVAMRESETRFRTAIDYLPEMFIIFDTEGQPRFANARMRRALGDKWEEMQERPIEEVMPPKMVALYRSILAQAVETGKEVVEEHSIELDDSKQVVLLFNYLPLYNEQGHIYEVLGIAKDITQQKLSEKAMAEQKDLLSLRVQERTAELSRANAQLVDAMRAKDEFLATINHELRTPLTSVILGAQMLQSEVYGTPSSEQKQFLDMIERNSQRLLTLINDILYFSKLEAGQFEPQMTTIDVSQLCHDALHTARDLAAQKDVGLQLDIEKPLGSLRADERGLKQILGNLLNNAVKFTEEGGQVGLRVTTDAAQQLMSFCVWDTGIGISTENMERVFQPFVQVDSGLARQYEGSGLGLALTKRLTDLHGGSISLSSTVGSGSRFTVSLPLSQAERNGEAFIGIIRRSPNSAKVDALDELRRYHPATEITDEHLVPVGLPSASTSGATYKVLIAEDTEHTLKTLTIFFQYRNCQVVMARNGVEAIERTLEEKPDVILIDIQMPILGGLEAIERIREHPTGQNIPIVALTALTMPGDREKCLQAGADLYVPKPVNMHELFETIQQMVPPKDVPAQNEELNAANIENKNGRRSGSQK